MEPCQKSFEWHRSLALRGDYSQSKVGHVPGDGSGGRGRLVLSEEAAVEVLAYLITAARTQLDEASEYAPLRLLGAARKLADHLYAGASTPVRSLISALDTLPVTATPSADPEAYAARLDLICIAVADCLLAGPDRENGDG